jgi:SARP family transcriptional regulator, regulator of embCAB operon
LAQRIYLLGRVAIESGDRIVEASDFPGRQGRLAFVFLAAEPRRIDRARLADAIWDEELPDQWMSALAAIMSKLRKVLADAGMDAATVLDGRDASYELRFPVGTWIDLQTAINSLDRAEGLLRQGRPTDAWPEASVASSIFRRPFLAGESGEWVERLRRDLHEYEIRTFDALARVWLALNQPVAALQAARRVLDLAPFRESAHGRVMECHLAAGDRAEAVRVYDRLRKLLEETMGLSPNNATEELYERALK